MNKRSWSVSREERAAKNFPERVMSVVEATAAPPPALISAPTVTIPGWVVDHESFRRWARGDDFPRHGRFAYISGSLWVDPSMEELFTHNLVKTRITVALANLVDSGNLGYVFSDRALLTHPQVGLSTEPDVLYCSWESVRA